MPLSGLDLLLWAAGLLGHLILLAVLVGRGRASRFPIFTLFIAASVLRTIGLFLVRSHDEAYTVLYIATELIDVLLQLGVVYEVASYTFRPLGGWAPDVQRGMWCLIGGSLAVASGMTWLATPVASGWSALLVKAGFFSSTVMSEVFLGMVVLSVTVGLPWKTHVARIAHGLGVYSTIDVAIEAAHTLHGAIRRAQVDEALSYGRKAVYLACLVYWIVTLWQDAPEAREVSAQMRKQLLRLQARVAYDLYTLRKGREP